MKKHWIAALAACFLVVVSCSKSDPSRRYHDAIRAALEKQLSERRGLDVAAMDMDIKQITINGNRAQAHVEFRAKEGGASMQMVYELERQGDTWVVRSRGPGSGLSHPAMGDMPPPGSTELPAGHPPLSESSGARSKSTSPPKQP